MGNVGTSIFGARPKQMCKSQGCLGHSRFHLFVMCLMRIPQPYSNLVLNCCNCPLIYCNNQIRSHLTGSPLPFPGVKEKQLNMCSGRDHAEYIENVTIHLKWSPADWIQMRVEEGVALFMCLLSMLSFCNNIKIILTITTRTIYIFRFIAMFLCLDTSCILHIYHIESKR